ncbi:hypothetical protein ASE63_13870 [Bosea sp. Root381]|uniref:DUF6894 family protein n=1 Tax=Bosea sp. Root381 TaxID=1736524 RepID=UPI0006F70AE5|nr:hypothetical protein [Bosea sp. Root381]KRE16818.1 hypothetical protein ASE63_13870 [Bosea sp. Root381]
MRTFKVTTVVDGDVSENDVEFESEKAVTDDAQLSLADVVREKLPNGSHAAFSAKVEDEYGTEVYRASLDFRAKGAQEIADDEIAADEAAAAVASALANPLERG